MGCDIHLALERRLRNLNKNYYSFDYDATLKKHIVTIDKKSFHEEYDKTWRPCPILGKVETGDRIYGIFSYLANVRNYSEEKHPQPKGIPEDTSYSIMRDYTILINDEQAKRYKESEEKYEWAYAVTEEEAKQWVEEWESKIYEFPPVRRDGKPERRVSGPDWHSGSWATREELQDAFDKLYVKDYEDKKVFIGEYEYYLGILKLMEAFEENGDYEVRMVYWFDN